METKRLTIPAAEELLGKYFPCLDHGFVALVDYMGGDEAVDDAARTSYGAGTRKVHEREGLLRYLRRQRHTSPSEMVEVKLHCSMPIVVARQWIRHRTANVNEYSGRYSLMPMMFYTPPDDQYKKQSSKNRQGRGDVAEQSIIDEAKRRTEALRRATAEHYEWMVEHEFARELARIDLPLSAYTQWYWKIDLHNLLHFAGLRSDLHAQWEVRVFSDVIVGMVKRLAPHTFQAWVDYDFAGARMSRMELNMLRDLLTWSELHVQPDPGCEAIGTGKMQSHYKLSKREVEEFFKKLDEKPIPHFDLDLSQAKTGEYFQEMWESFVPKVDREQKP
jgi:thymidylate synthase (FAD)